MTTIRGFPFDTGFNSASYEDDFTEYFQHVLPTGVLPARSDSVLGVYANEFKVFGDSTGMQVKVYQGRAVVKGHFAKISDSDAPLGYLSMTITAADATNPRIDRVVLKVDRSANAASIEVKAGTPGATPSAPSLTQGNTTWELPLAMVYVAAGATTIAPADVMDERVFSITPDELARTSHLDDPIINGGFLIWSVGTTFASVADAAYGPECWQYFKSGATVHTLQRSTDVPTLNGLTAPYMSYSTHLDVTTADTSISAGEYVFLRHTIEGYRFAPFAQQAFTFGFWVKDSVVGPHAVAFANSGSDRSCVIEYMVHAADTWEYKIIRVPASPSAGTWDYANGAGLKITFTLAIGSTYHTTTPGQWTTGLYFGTARTVNSVNSTANNFKIAHVGPLKPGGYAYPFLGRPFDVERRLCARYYEQSYGLETAPGTATSTGAVRVDCDATSTNQVSGWEFMATKRATPTVTIFSVGGTQGTTSNLSSADAGGTSCTVSTSQERVFQCIAGAGAFTANTAYILQFNANARL